MSKKTSNDALDALEQLYAILRLAQANFPGTVGVQISTSGSSPQASMTVPYYILMEIADKAKAAMEARDG